MIPPAVSASLNLQRVSLQGSYDREKILTLYRLHLRAFHGR